VQLDLPAGSDGTRGCALLDAPWAIWCATPGSTRVRGNVSLKIAREERELLIVVADDGPGVEPAALERLGEPFIAPRAARTRETGGAGLGLTIVKSAAEACRGRVIFRNRVPRGFEAESA